MSGEVALYFKQEIGRLRASAAVKSLKTKNKRVWTKRELLVLEPGSAPAECFRQVFSTQVVRLEVPDLVASVIIVLG